MGRQGAEDFARLVDYQPAYRPGARRFDMGEAPNFALLPMVETALARILDWGVPAIQSTLAARTAAIAARAARSASPAATPRFAPATSSASPSPARSPPASPTASPPPRSTSASAARSLRVTPHLWNDDEDVDRLFDALAAV